MKGEAHLTDSLGDENDRCQGCLGKVSVQLVLFLWKASLTRKDTDGGKIAPFSFKQEGCYTREGSSWLVGSRTVEKPTASQGCKKGVCIPKA